MTEDDKAKIKKHHEMAISHLQACIDLLESGGKTVDGISIDTFCSSQMMTEKPQTRIARIWFQLSYF